MLHISSLAFLSPSVSSSESEDGFIRGSDLQARCTSQEVGERPPAFAAEALMQPLGFTLLGKELQELQVARRDLLFRSCLKAVALQGFSGSVVRILS